VSSESYMSKLNRSSRSILYYKCPTCLKGDLYPHKVLSFKGWFKMNDHCPVCGQKFMLEPGFYWGAMYVSYGVCSALIFALFALFYFVFNLDETLSFFIAISFLFFLYPIIFRSARAIWLNVFI